LYPIPQEKRVETWFQAQGDKTLRLDYDLDENSLVLDVGGYAGQWTSDIFAMYQPTIHIFEPVQEFAENIRRRFQFNPKIKVYAVGLAGDTQTLEIYLNKDGSSVFLKSGCRSESIKLIRASDFLSEQAIDWIDLMKINIEGGEYGLLTHLIKSGWVRRIRDIQVQFHDYVPDAEMMMTRIQQSLHETHELTYQYRFVWENWHLRQ